MKAHKAKNAHVLRLDPGEEIIKSISDYCQEEKITCGTIQAIGAVNQVTLAFFTPKTKEYSEQKFTGDYEVCPLVGNVSTMDGKIYLHCHINLSGKDYKSFGGHLKAAYVSATCEIFIMDAGGELHRKKSEEIGLNLLDLE